MKRSHVRLCGSKEQKWCLSCLLQLTLLSMDILVIYKVKWSHKWKKSWQGPERPRGHSINMVFILFICIYMYTCSYVCVCVFSYMWLYMSEVSLARPLAIFRFLFIFFFPRQVSHWSWSCKYGQADWPLSPRKLPSLPPQCWDDKGMPPHLVFSQWFCVESQPRIEF